MAVRPELTPAEAADRLALAFEAARLDRIVRYLLDHGVYTMVRWWTVMTNPRVRIVARCRYVSSGLQAARGLGQPIVPRAMPSVPSTRQRMEVSASAPSFTGVAWSASVVDRGADRRRPRGRRRKPSGCSTARR